MKGLILACLLFSHPRRYQYLEWSDFKGIPHGDHLAETVSEITLITTEENGRCRFESKAVFLPEESFTTTRDLEVLGHENTHFRITQLYAQITANLCIEYAGCSNSKLKSFNAKFDHILVLWQDCEHRFDQETDYHRNKKAELSWEKWVKLQLNDTGTTSAR